jgi:hypothetical protein
MNIGRLCLAKAIFRVNQNREIFNPYQGIGFPDKGRKAAPTLSKRSPVVSVWPCATECAHKVSVAVQRASANTPRGRRAASAKLQRPSSPKSQPLTVHWLPFTPPQRSTFTLRLTRLASHDVSGAPTV